MLVNPAENPIKGSVLRSGARHPTAFKLRPNNVAGLVRRAQALNCSSTFSCYFFDRHCLIGTRVVLHWLKIFRKIFSGRCLIFVLLIDDHVEQFKQFSASIGVTQNFDSVVDGHLFFGVSEDKQYGHTATTRSG